MVGEDERSRWAEEAAATASTGDLEAVLSWATARFGWGTDISPSQSVGPPVWGEVFDLYMRELEAMLAPDDRATLQGRLVFAAPPPAAAPEPPRGGRPPHTPFLRITAKNSLWPAKLARQATGDDADYIRSLNPLNPHLCANGAWKAWLVPGDEINLPARYADALSDPSSGSRPGRRTSI